MTIREATDVLKVLKAVCEETFGEGEAEALQMAIDALEKQEWIPVSERLPEHYKQVLFCDEDDDIYLGCYSAKSQWVDSVSVANVVAWMEKPQSYKGADV